MVHWYHGNKVHRTRAERHPHREADSKGSQGSGRVSRSVAGRSARRHRAACLRRESAFRSRVPQEDRRAQEGLQPRPHQRRLAQARGAEEMTERELIARFESCAVPNAGFHHRDHVQVVWAYLREMPVVEALSRFTTSLKRFAVHHGKTMLYHETITWAYVALVHERMEQHPGVGCDEFCRRNPDLLTW